MIGFEGLSKWAKGSRDANLLSPSLLPPIANLSYSSFFSSEGGIPALRPRLGTSVYSVGIEAFLFKREAVLLSRSTSFISGF